MNEQNASVQDAFLATLHQDHTLVSVYLMNGIRLIGRIESFDAYALLLKSDTTQLVYKRAIATIMPANGNGDVREERHEGAESKSRKLKDAKTTVVVRRRPREII